MVFQLQLATEKVGQMSLPPARCVGPEATLSAVLGELKSARRGSVSICRDGRLIGIFTERDALRSMAEHDDLNTPIERLMSTPVVTVSRDDTIEAAIARMSLGGYRRLPVVDDQQRPLGVLSVSSILHYLVQHFPEFVYNLPPTPEAAAQQREGA